ncbi:MAG: LLM class flavin-dependent oxidoreductase [Dehalococcoidia bacterium]|nr:LLM class flavin-dependent oxidoreductase [Dehalococcoidia bacterium]
MSKQQIGVAAMGGDAKAVVERIIHLEKTGVPAAWLTSGGIPADSLSVFAAAAVRTERILMGTCIMQTWPRHPLTMAANAQVINTLAPGRFRLGIGPSHKAGIESTYGFTYDAPLSHLKEYIRIIRTLFTTGLVDFDGKYHRAHTRLPAPTPGIPVMASALRRKSYEVCGEVADGAISWVSPPTFLRDVCLPAIKEGARKANRPAPPLVAHIPVCVHTNIAEARTAAREQLANYPRTPFYQAMFADAGFPEAKETSAWSDRMLDTVVAMGDEESVVNRLREIFAMGMGEIIVHPIPAGQNKAASTQRVYEVVTAVARSLPK